MSLIDSTSAIDASHVADVEATRGAYVGLTLDFEPSFTTLRKKKNQVTLEWKNIEYYIGKRAMCGFGSEAQGKPLIGNISGRSVPGEVIAIMGPSGAGKTTLLNILAGRIVGGTRGRVVKGDFFVNGERMHPATFRKSVAYVTQEDALFPTSTAREALEFSARLRLSTAVSQADRDLLVNDMLDSLGLTNVQHTLVGSAMIRGLSGGERKRVAIGVELVSSPSCLFLDEPTSGLDSYSAWKVVRILNAIAATGCPILCSIHQPSSEIFHEFSSLILLRAGKVIYQGSVDKINLEFAKYNMAAPKHINIADHMMLCVQTRAPSDLPSDDHDAKRPALSWGSTTSVHQQTASASMMSRSLGMVESIFAKSGDSADQKPGVFVQTYALSLREIRATYRDVGSLAGRFGGLIVIDILEAIIFTHTGDFNLPGYTTQSHFGGIVVIFIMGMFLVAQPSLLTFPMERMTYLREKATNTYGTVPYVVSKLLLELPLLFLSALLTFLILYWALGLHGNFIQLVAALWVSMLAAVSAAYILGAAVPDAKMAIEMVPILFVPQMLFFGFFVNINQIPEWLGSWVPWIVPVKYGLNLAMIVEFSPAICVAAPPSKDVCSDWATLLQSNNVDANLAWLYSLIVILLFAMFRCIAIFILSMRASNFDF